MNTCITLHNFTDSPKICWAGNFINSFRIEIASICYNAFSLLFLNLELGGIIQMLMLMWYNCSWNNWNIPVRNTQKTNNRWKRRKI